MLDALGIPIEEGDSVAMSDTYQPYVEVLKVVNFTDRYVVLSDGDLYNSEDIVVVTQQIEQNKINHPELHI